VAVAGPGQGARNPNSGSRLILEELRDLRLEMRADRRHAEDERRRSEERLGRIMRDFRQDIRTVGLLIVKTLNPTRGSSNESTVNLASRA
jgi:hypothetical protein